MTKQFGSKFGCGASLGATQVQIFQTFCPDFSDSNTRRDYAIWVYIPMRRDPWRVSFPDFPDLMTRFSRLKLSSRLCNFGLNPDRARPLAWFMSRNSRPFCPDFLESNSRRDYAIWVKTAMRRDPWHDSCPDYPEFMSRLSRLKFSARICSLELNPDAARPLARLSSRFFRPNVQTFQTQLLGVTLQFASKSRCGATLGAIHVQAFQTL